MTLHTNFNQADRGIGQILENNKPLINQHLQTQGQRFRKNIKLSQRNNSIKLMFELLEARNGHLNLF